MNKPIQLNGVIFDIQYEVNKIKKAANFGSIFFVISELIFV